MRERLSEVGADVDTSISDEKLNELLTAADNQRLLALLTIRRKIEDDFIPAGHFFDIAKTHLLETDNDCKWQAFIIIGLFMETKPEECWEIILKYGNLRDKDTQAAVATILLEHFFEKNPHQFDKKFRVLRKMITRGDKNLLKTLLICWSTWGSDINKSRVNRFIRSFK